MTMREEVDALKRKRIIDAASALFFERGFTRTTLDDIDQTLNVTKPFIYTHFASKADLLNAVCRPPIEELATAASETAKSSLPNRKKLERIAFETARLTIEHQVRLRIYVQELQGLDESTRSEIEALRAKRTRVVTDLLKVGVASGEFSIINNDVPTASASIIGMISGLTMASKPLLHGERTAEIVARTVMRMVGVRETRNSSNGTARTPRKKAE